MLRDGTDPRRWRRLKDRIILSDTAFESLKTDRMCVSDHRDEDAQSIKSADMNDYSRSNHHHSPQRIGAARGEGQICALVEQRQCACPKTRTPMREKAVVVA